MDEEQFKNKTTGIFNIAASLNSIGPINVPYRIVRGYEYFSNKSGKQHKNSKLIQACSIKYL